MSTQPSNLPRRLPFAAVLAAVIGLAASSAALAAPVRIDYATIAPDTIETFAGYPDGDRPSGAAYIGFVFETATPAVTSSAPFCAGTLAPCLLDRLSFEIPRVFSGFAAGTVQFGVKLDALVPSNTFDVAVVGNSGAATFVITPGADDPIALGFFDASGLLSVTFTLRPALSGLTGNYNFDDVLTADAVPIPLPATSVLLLAGLAGLLGFRKQRGNAVLPG